MTQGARTIDIDQAEVPSTAPTADPPFIPDMQSSPEPAGRRWLARVTAALLVAAALAWVGLLGFNLAQAGEAVSPLRLLAWLGLGAGPLALLAVLGLLIDRGGRLRIADHRASAEALRGDAAALTATMAELNSRIEAARGELSGHAGVLADLGANTSGRLARAAGELGTQAEIVRRAAMTLDEATTTARADLGVLLSDLPRAEEAAQTLAERLRQGGAEADTRARALVDVLGALDERARAASEASGGAAARLAAQLERVDEGATAADRRIAETAASMGATVDRALEAATAGVEETRRAIAGQSAALTAMVDQGRAALDAAGLDAAQAMAARLDAIATRIAGLGEGLQAQDRAAADWLDGMARALDGFEARLAELGQSGAARTGELGAALEGVHGQANAVTSLLASQDRAATAMLGRVVQLREQAEAGSTTLGETIPAALARVRLHAEQSLQGIAQAEERGERLHDTMDAVTARLAEAEALLARQREMMEGAGEQADHALTLVSDKASALRTLVVRTDAEVRELSDAASAGLVEALFRVREAANEAGEQARDALSAAIPRAAQRLGESAARALTTALTEVAAGEMQTVGDAAAKAVDAARAASERMAQQLLTIAQTATAIDARIAENQTETEAHDEASFARTASLLIEALNSTSIDLVRVLASEVSEEDWKSYLRGERGVFTRRTVKLLERGEAGEVARRYESEAEFQAQVNRYIHDFEALLRRVMATHEGEGMASTLLSSDLGKLYVALAQAIERLRR